MFCSVVCSVDKIIKVIITLIIVIVVDFGRQTTRNCKLAICHLLCTNVPDIILYFSLSILRSSFDFSPLACSGSSAGSQCVAWRRDGKHGHFHRCRYHGRSSDSKPCAQGHSGEPLLPSDPGCTTSGTSTYFSYCYWIDIEDYSKII